MAVVVIAAVAAVKAEVGDVVAVAVVDVSLFVVDMLVVVGFDEAGNDAVESMVVFAVLLDGATVSVDACPLSDELPASGFICAFVDVESIGPTASVCDALSAGVIEDISLISALPLIFYVCVIEHEKEYFIPSSSMSSAAGLVVGAKELG